MTAPTAWTERWDHLRGWGRGVARGFARQFWAATGAVRRAGKEIAVVALGLVGWGILTHVIVLCLGPVVWEVSLGLLCLSLFGWKFAYHVARDGVYALSLRGKKP